MSSKQMKSVRTGGMARIMGVTTQTIRHWCKNDDIHYHTLPSGQYYFTPEDIQNNTKHSNTNNDTQQTWWYYTRSSSGDKNIHQTQQKQLEHAYPPAQTTIKDNASGLNENRQGLKRILDGAREHEYTDLAITTKDRLTRFGYSYLERYLSEHDVTIHVVADTDTTAKAPEQELMDDFMALIASFSGRFYRLRSKANQKRLLDAAQSQLEQEDEDL